MIQAIPIRLINALLIGVILAASVMLAYRPYYNWDMFPYMALILEKPGTPFDSTHRETYRQARSQMPPQDFHAISARQPVLRDNAGAFQEILPYYRVKPGYTLLATGLAYVGIPTLMATWLPSILSYGLLCLALYYWSRSVSPPFAAALFTLVAGFSPPMIDLARYSSPDMLCALISLIGTIGVLGRRTWGLPVMALSLTVRPDAVLVFLPMLAALRMAGHITTIRSALWAVGASAYLFLLFFDTGLIEEFAFFGLTISERLTLYQTALITTLPGTYVIPLTAVGVWVLWLRRKAARPDLLQLLVWAALISMVARLLLQPYAEDRFNLPGYLVILLAGWSTVSGRLFARGTA